MTSTELKFYLKLMNNLPKDHSVKGIWMYNMQEVKDGFKVLR